MDENTQLMYEAAERLYAEIGERHGYSGVCAGLYTVLSSKSPVNLPSALADPDLGGSAKEVADPRWYFSRVFHDPLANYHSDFVNQTVTFAEIANAIDKKFEDRGEVTLQEPFENILAHRYPWPLDRTPGVSIRGEIESMELQTLDYLKKHKLRKNTAKWRAFHEEYAQSVIDKGVGAATRSLESARTNGAIQIQKLKELALRAQSNLKKLLLADTVRSALLQIAGLPSDTIASSQTLERGRLWERAIANIDEHIAYFEETLDSMKPDAITLVSMERSEVLKPFLVAVGLAS